MNFLQLRNWYLSVAELISFEPVPQLKEIHRHSVLHCDLRRSNLLRFDVKDMKNPKKQSENVIEYQIIDFDLAQLVPEGQKRVSIALAVTGVHNAIQLKL
jgi:serine/threonine protein kinase